MPQERSVSVVDSYDTQYDPSLFIEQVGWGRSMLRSIRDSASALLDNIAGKEEEGLTFNNMLTDLVGTAYEHKEWPHWRYRSEEGRGNLPRAFTPPFAKASYGSRHLLTRLHIVPPQSPFKQSIIHIEKIAFGDGAPQTFDGQEIIWSRGSEERPLMNIGTGSRRLIVSPEQNSEFWQSAVSMVTAAHAEFVE